MDACKAKARNTKGEALRRPSHLSYAASVTARAIEVAEEQGIRLTRLTLLIIQEVARSGVRCFLKIRSIAERIIQNNGKRPHPGSVQRLIAFLRDSQILLGRRLFPGQKAQFKAHGKPFKVNAGQGCLLMWFNKRLDFPDFEDDDLGAAVATAPRHIAVNAIVPSEPAQKVAPDDLALFEAMAAPAIAATAARQEQREQRDDSAMFESVQRARGHPP